MEKFWRIDIFFFACASLRRKEERKKSKKKKNKRNIIARKESILSPKIIGIESMEREGDDSLVGGGENRRWEGR